MEIYEPLNPKLRMLELFKMIHNRCDMAVFLIENGYEGEGLFTLAEDDHTDSQTIIDDFCTVKGE